MSYEYKNGILHAEDVPLPHIAESVSTPCYVYSSDVIRDRATRLMTAVQSPWPSDKKPMLAFACKANSNIAILNFIAKLGFGMDIVSGGELQRCQAAGIDPSRIIFSGVGKTDEELSLAIESGVHQINVESEAELLRLDEISRKLKKPAKVALRYTPDVKSGAHVKTSTGEEEDKFGLLEGEILKLFEQFSNHPFMRLDAVSMHIGSGVPKLDPFREAFNRLAALVVKLRDAGATVDQVDLGGGLWIPYTDEPFPDLEAYGKMIYEIFAPLDVKIALEPGRLIVAESGVLLTSVIFNKQRTIKRFVVADAAMNDLIRPTLYDAHHNILPVRKVSELETVCDLVGPVCESGDYLAQDRMLPPLDRGDLLAVCNAGAYGSVMSSTYNTRPFIPEVLVSGKQFYVIRARQKTEDTWANERIPS